MRLARRGQDARSRTILASVLLVTLLIFIVVWFRTPNLVDLFFGTQQVLDIKESARFAEQFSLTLLLAQLAVMVLLTPAYAAGSIAEEKERRTWPYLLATELSNREIVLGKFCARMVFLLGVMFAGLPVLALTGLVGGVDPVFLVFGYVLTGSTVALLTAAGVTAAVYATTFRGAMFRAYGIAALYVFFGGGIYPLFSPFAVLIGLYQIREQESWFFTLAGGYIAVQWLLTLIFLGIGIRRLRRVERRAPQRRRRPPQDLDDPAIRRPRRIRDAEENRWGDRDHPRERRRHRSPEWAEKPPIAHRNPFVWKERYTLGTKRSIDDESIKSLLTVIGVLVAVFVAFIVLIALLVGTTTANGAARTASVLIFAGIAACFMHLMSLGPAACSAILRERTNLTLEPLLIIPVPRTDILIPKWTVTFSRGWWWGGAGLFCLALGFYFSPMRLMAVPVLFYFPAAAALCVSVGLWLSCRSATVVRAVMIDISVAGGLMLAPLLIWWSFEPREQVAAAIVMAGAAVAVALAAWVFWKKTVGAFEAYGRD